MDALYAWLTVFVAIGCVMVYFFGLFVYPGLLELVLSVRLHKYRLLALLFFCLSLGPVYYIGISSLVTRVEYSMKLRMIILASWFCVSAMSLCLPNPRLQKKRQSPEYMELKAGGLRLSRQEWEELHKPGTVYIISSRLLMAGFFASFAISSPEIWDFIHIMGGR